MALLQNFVFPHLPLPSYRRRDRAHIKMREFYLDIMKARRASPEAVSGLYSLISAATVPDVISFRRAPLSRVARHGHDYGPSKPDVQVWKTSDRQADCSHHDCASDGRSAHIR